MTTSRLPFILYDGRACGGGGRFVLCSASGSNGYGLVALVALVDLEADVGFADDPMFEGLAGFSAVSCLVRRFRRRP